jgi:hypothetical protein
VALRASSRWCDIDVALRHVDVAIAANDGTAARANTFVECRQVLEYIDEFARVALEAATQYELARRLL